MTDIELVKQFSGREPQFVYTFPRFLVYNVGGWDGLIKLDNETKKCSTFMPFDYPKELIMQYFKDPEPVGDILHSDTVNAVYSELFDDHIEHHGILNMKWGKRNGPPYPLKPDAHSKAEKNAAEKAGVKVGKSSGKGSIENVEPKKNIIEKAVDAYKDNKKKKQRAENLQKAREAAAKKREEAKAAEQHEADKKKALESGDYSQIQKYAHEASTRELQDALTRADTLKRLERSVVENTPVEPTIWDQVSDAANKIGTATNAASKGIEAWNKVATVWNTFADPEAALPEIGKNFNEMKEKLAKDKAERARKAYVDKIIKNNNPAEIIANQELFTSAEVKEAKERLGNLDGLKQIDKNRAKEAEKTKFGTDVEGTKWDDVRKLLDRNKVKDSNNDSKSKEETSKKPDDDNSSTKKKTFSYEDYDFPDDDNGSVKKSFEKASTKSISDSSALSNSIFDYLNSVDSDWRMKQ